MTPAAGVTIHGDVAEGFGPIADRFRANWADAHELGAAVAIYVDGRNMVDLWAGIADATTGRRWSRDTPALVFSVSKGVLALCLHHLVDRGLVDLDAPVASYWPQFAAHGKETVPVRWLLSHRTGLAVLDADLTMDDVCDWDRMIEILEEQQPNWPPGSSYAYHALTYGWLVGELVRRVSGDLPGRYLQRHFCEPLQLDTWFGLPDDLVDVTASIHVGNESWFDDGLVATIADTIAADDRAWRSLSLNGAIHLPIGTVSRRLDYNRSDVLRAQIPGANLVTTARSLAKLYASVVGDVDGGSRTLSAAALEQATVEQSSGPPLFGFGIPGDSRWAVGFQLSSTVSRPMLGEQSFGHDGAAGGLAFADSAAGVGFAYVNNQMEVPDDDRANGLVRALAGCLS